MQPVEIRGRTIAGSFWGRRWCEHLESFSDYANRLPRGRTYVRNADRSSSCCRAGCPTASWTRSQRYRTLAALRLDARLRDPVTTPIYQQIAFDVVNMRARGDTFAAITRHFRVDPRTVKKAIRWFRQRST